MMASMWSRLWVGREKTLEKNIDKQFANFDTRGVSRKRALDLGNL